MAKARKVRKSSKRGKKSAARGTRVVIGKAVFSCRAKRVGKGKKKSLHAFCKRVAK